MYKRQCLVVFIVLLVALSSCTGLCKKDFKGWKEYKSETGLTFMYPPAHVVHEKKDPKYQNAAKIFVVPIDETGKTVGPPAVQINVSDHDFSIGLWEAIPWPAYPKIIETFQFNKK